MIGNDRYSNSKIDNQSDLGPEISINGLSPTKFKVLTNFIGSSATDAITNGVTKQFSGIEEKISNSNKFLRPYFAISNESFLYRIKSLLLPFFIKNWSRAVENQDPIPLNNSNLPELYTPLVFSFLFFLLHSIIKGFKNEYSFEKASLLTIKFGFTILLEVLFAKLLFFTLGLETTHSILTLFSDFGCISFYLCLISFLCWNNYLRTFSLIYSSLALLWWAIRTLSSDSSIAGKLKSPSKFQTYSIIGLSLLQVLVLLIFAPKI